MAQKWGVNVVLIRLIDLADQTCPSDSISPADGEQLLAEYTAPTRIDSARAHTNGATVIEKDELSMVAMVSGANDTEGLDVPSTRHQYTASCGRVQADGIIDISCVSQAHQMLPWGSHYRNLTSKSGHAWVAKDLATDLQVIAASIECERLSALMSIEGTQPIKVEAYSDGSVVAQGVEGSAASVICIGGVDVSAIVRLASADTPLSSGRAEWVGLILVLITIRRVRLNVDLRLGNLQVVNAFNDGKWAFTRNWLRQKDRDMALMAWQLLDDRRKSGLGRLTAIHQKGHAEQRKSRKDFNVHQIYNDKADALTHQLTRHATLCLFCKGPCWQNDPVVRTSRRGECRAWCSS